MQEEIRAQVVIPGAGLDHTIPALREHRSLPAPGIATDAPTPRAWDEWIAFVVSQVGSPPVLAPVAISLMAAASTAPRAWMWAGGYIALTVLAPFLYLFWLLHRGLVTDLDVQRREQRTRPLIFTLACGALAWLLLVVGRAPWPMIVLAGQLWLQTLLIFGITLYWKISVHCTTAAAVAALVWALFGTPLPLLVGVPLIAWSRVRQHRHTLAQTVAGSLLGIVMTLVALSLIAGR